MDSLKMHRNRPTCEHSLPYPQEYVDKRAWTVWTSGFLFEGPIRWDAAASCVELVFSYLVLNLLRNTLQYQATLKVVKMQGNDKTWTTALKYALTDLKWLLTWSTRHPPARTASGALWAEEQHGQTQRSARSSVV